MPLLSKRGGCWDLLAHPSVRRKCATKTFIKISFFCRKMTEHYLGHCLHQEDLHIFIWHKAPEFISLKTLKGFLSQSDKAMQNVIQQCKNICTDQCRIVSCSSSMHFFNYVFLFIVSHFHCPMNVTSWDKQSSNCLISKREKTPVTLALGLHDVLI